MLDFINGTGLENAKELDKGYANVELLKKSLVNLTNLVDFNTSTPEVNLLILGKYFQGETKRKLEEAKKEIKSLKEKNDIKISMENNRDYYTVQKNTICIDISVYINSAFAGILSWFYYSSNLSSYTHTSGHPDNGGIHSLSITDTKENIMLILDMLEDEYPGRCNVRKYVDVIKDNIKDLKSSTKTINLKKKIHEAGELLNSKSKTVSI